MLPPTPPNLPIVAVAAIKQTPRTSKKEKKKILHAVTPQDDLSPSPPSPLASPSRPSPYENRRFIACPAITGCPGMGAAMPYGCRPAGLNGSMGGGGM